MKKKMKAKYVVSTETEKGIAAEKSLFSDYATKRRKKKILTFLSDISVEVFRVDRSLPRTGLILCI